MTEGLDSRESADNGL